MADHWVKVLPDSSASIELDTDPTFGDTYPEAWFSVLVYIPSTAQTKLTADSPTGFIIQADGGGIGIKHITGTSYEWAHFGTSTGAPVIFDAWFQLEWHVVAGSHTIDFWINGTHYTWTKSGSAVSGANFFSAGSIVLGAGGNDATDWIGYDEMSSSLTGRVGSGADFIWSLEDSVDPLNDANTNYPTPPFNAFIVGRLSLESTGGGEAACDTIEGVPTCVNGNGNGGVGGPSSGSGYSSFQVLLDGADVTACSLNGSWTPRLNRPAQAQVKLPMDCSTAGVGSRLKIVLNGGIVFHGMVLLCETDCDDNFGYTTYNASDPMEMWQQRPARDGPDSGDPGDFSNPQMFQLFGPTADGGGPEIIRQMLLQSLDDSDPDKGEGDLFLDIAGGTYETGGCDLSGAPVDWPMTIADVVSLLVSTGCVDVVIVPIDSGGNMGQVNVYNGDFGTDLSGSVLFQYGTGAYNVSALRWNQDMSSLCNKLWYFMGPRVLTAADPAGNQHWCYNVQGDDPGLPTPIPNGASLATLLADRLTSRSTYGTRMDIQIFDATSENCDPLSNPLTATERQVYRRRWETESWIRQTPRNLIHITPTPGFEIGTFGIGDLVHVEATGAVRGGFSGAQRVYSYTVSWDENSVLSLSELQTSDTADA